jgi:ABC-type phosphate/phosphonate transport system ATPase subunit
VGDPAIYATTFFEETFVLTLQLQRASRFMGGRDVRAPYGRTLIRNIIIILAGLFVDDPIESSNDEILIAVRTQLG